MKKIIIIIISILLFSCNVFAQTIEIPIKFSVTKKDRVDILLLKYPNPCPVKATSTPCTVQTDKQWIGKVFRKVIVEKIREIDRRIARALGKTASKDTITANTPKDYETLFED